MHCANTSRISYNIRAATSKKTTLSQDTDVVERRRQLIRKIKTFQDHLCRRLPTVDFTPVSNEEPELVQLPLPSSRSNVLHDNWLRKVEDSLREAAARASLAKLQHHLRTRDVWLEFKQKHVRGVSSCTRLNHSIDSVHAKIRAAVWQYRQHRNMLVSLRGSGPWMQELKDLKDSDIRGVNERAYSVKELAESQRRVDLAKQLVQENAAELEDDLANNVGGHYLGRAPVQVGEGHRSLSWLWFNPALLQSGDSFDDPKLVGGAPVFAI
jgi:hypothetical protein